MKRLFLPLILLLVCAFCLCCKKAKETEAAPLTPPADTTVIVPLPPPVQPPVVPPTVIYIVRHAEKANNSADPDLSAAGQQRAIALRDTLQQKPVAALFATPYKRTRQTLQPLADHFQLAVQTYQPSDFTGLAQQIKSDFRTKTVVVAGHSNTVLEIAEALGATRPLAQLTETDYKYLFKISIAPDSTVTSETFTYGN